MSKWGFALLLVLGAGVALADDEKKPEEQPLGAAGPETVEGPPRQREQKDFSPLPAAR